MTSPLPLHRDAAFMEPIGIDDWKRWQQEGCSRLPFALVLKRESLPETWSALTQSLATVLLESALAGRYSYACDRPKRIILGRADLAEIWSADCETLLETRVGKPLELLRFLLLESRVPTLAGLPAMSGGLIGLFGYDLVHTWERLPFKAARDLRLPLYAMIEPAEFFVYDHREHTLFVIVWTDLGPSQVPASTLERHLQTATESARRALARWESRGETSTEGADATRNAGPSTPVGSMSPVHSFTPEDFQAAARRAKEFIAAGDTYQVNLSRRTSRLTAGSPTAIYQALRRINPSPYMGLLRLPEFSLVCGSPELLVRLVDGVVSSRPIAGTRRRGEAAAEDSHLSAELIANEKERAEHLMLVDLIRNDIGRVAAYGSVEVREFMVLERYSHVMHIVSQVEGKLAAGQTWVDVLQSMFPGGTITGCPKIRTMEIIEELEPIGRGFYTGALGWISYAGDMEMNIVIRSLLLQDGVAHVQAGSGIVADSHPEAELDEANRKAQALWVALGTAERKCHG